MLKNILTAYVRRNPTLGYCQGLNYVAAHLLRYMDEEEAFWTFAAIIERVLPLDHYLCMVGTLVDQKIFARLIRKTLPRVWTVLKNFGVSPHVVSVQWVVCLFTQNVQPEVTDGIWDRWFLSGSKVLFRAGLALLMLLEKNLTQCKCLGTLCRNCSGGSADPGKGSLQCERCQRSHANHVPRQVQVH